MAAALGCGCGPKIISLALYKTSLHNLRVHCRLALQGVVASEAMPASQSSWGRSPYGWATVLEPRFDADGAQSPEVEMIPMNGNQSEQGQCPFSLSCSGFQSAT
jgi:hypothetical protein